MKFSVIVPRQQFPVPLRVLCFVRSLSEPKMAAPRLPFLYPNLMRAVRSCEPPTHRSFRFSPSRGARIHTSCCRLDQGEAYQRRYGAAAEPNLPPPSRPNEAGQPANVRSESSKPEALADQSQDGKTLDPKTPSDTETEANEGEEDNSEPQEEDTSFTAADTVPDLEQSGTPPNNKNLFEDVLHMPSPSKELVPPSAAAHDDRPHLRAGLYVHHFDTYSLVRDIAKGGFTDDQSITIMKALRGLLHKNLDLAKAGLISKSDFENEVYLFKAACSELQSSLQAARNSEMQTQRASRTQLQHEADILSQRLNQELAGLKDDIQGMFNDHKMTTREQQRSIDTSIQELNYKITVSLNSDGKSEIEGLRWILTRRAAFALAISAGKLAFLSTMTVLSNRPAMIIAFLKYSAVHQARKTEEAQKPKEPPAKEAVEPRDVRDAASQAPAIIPEAHLSESLG